MSLEDMFSVPDTSLFRGGSGKKKSRKESTPKGASVAMQHQWQEFSRDEKWNLRLKNKDSDMDGIPDPWDCQPMNPLMQDTYTPAQLEEINNMGRLEVGGFISNGAFGSVFEVKSKDPAMQAIADKYVIKVSNNARREADDFSDPDSLSARDKKILGYAKVYEKRYGRKPSLEHLSRKFGTSYNFTTHDEIKAYKEQGMDKLKLITPQKPMLVDLGPFQTLGMLKPKVDVFAEHGVKRGKEHLITPEIMEQIRVGTNEFTANDFHIWDSYQVGVAKDAEGNDRAWIFDTDVISPSNENQWNLREKGGSVATANEYVWDAFKRQVKDRSGMENLSLIQSNLGGPNGRTGFVKNPKPMNKEYVELHNFYYDGEENGFIGIWKVGDGIYVVTACYRSQKGGPLHSIKKRYNMALAEVYPKYEELLKCRHISEAYTILEQEGGDNARVSTNPMAKKMGGTWQRSANAADSSVILKRIFVTDSGDRRGAISLISTPPYFKVLLENYDKDSRHHHELSRDITTKHAAELVFKEYLKVSFDEVTYRITGERKQPSTPKGLNAVFASDKLGLLDQTGTWLDSSDSNENIIIKKEFWKGNRSIGDVILGRTIDGKLVITLGDSATGDVVYWIPKKESLANDEPHMKTIYTQVVSGDFQHAINVINLMRENDEKDAPKNNDGWQLVKNQNRYVEQHRYYVDDIARCSIGIMKHGTKDYSIRLVPLAGANVIRRFKANLKDVRVLYMSFLKLTKDEAIYKLANMEDGTLGEGAGKPRWIRAPQAKEPVIIKRYCVVDRETVGFCVLSRKDDGTTLIATTKLREGSKPVAKTVSWEPKDTSLAKDVDRMKMLFEQVSQGTLDDSQEMLRNLKRNDQSPAKKEGWAKDSRPMGAFLEKANWFENGEAKGFVAIGKNLNSEKAINVVRRGDSQNESFRGYWNPADAIKNDSERMHGAFEDFLKGDLDDAVGNMKGINDAKKRVEERKKEEQRGNNRAQLMRLQHEAARTTGKPMVEGGLNELFASGSATPESSRGVVTGLLSGPWNSREEPSPQRWSPSGITLASFPSMPSPKITPTPTRTPVKATGWVQKGANSHEWRTSAGNALGTMFVTGLEVRLLDHKNNVMYSTGEWVSESEARAIYESLLKVPLAEMLANRKKYDFTEIVGVGN